MNKTMYGLDFGTSNSAVATLVDGTVRVLPVGENGSTTIPSVLFFPEHERRYYVGELATQQYVRSGMQGRFIQSVKSFLPDQTFTGTAIHGFGVRTLEDLVAMQLSNLKQKADAIIGEDVRTVVLGRPVVFSEDATKDQLAEQRLYTAARQAGFDTIYFHAEPSAAALHYEMSITRAELTLVADFGGGTTDFTLIRLSPHTNSTGIDKSEILGTAGTYIGGNSFDSEIMWTKLTKYFGANIQFKAWDKWLSIPAYLIRTLGTWHRIHLLKDRKTREFLRELLRSADDQHAVACLIALIEENLGFSLFQAIEASKCQLSTHDCSPISFHQSVIDIEEVVTKIEFEHMIAERLASIQACIETLFDTAGVRASDIDSVFMTGGTSFVPRIRTMLEDMFGAEKMQIGDAFTSVVSGLAWRSRSLSAAERSMGSGGMHLAARHG